MFTHRKCRKAELDHCSEMSLGPWRLPRQGCSSCGDGGAGDNGAIDSLPRAREKLRVDTSGVSQRYGKSDTERICNKNSLAGLRRNARIISAETKSNACIGRSGRLKNRRRRMNFALCPSPLSSNLSGDKAKFV